MNTNTLCTVGVIAGIVSYTILWIVTLLLDFLSSKTNGAFGYNTDPEHVEEKPHVDGPEARTVTFKHHPQNEAELSSHSDDSQAAKVRFSITPCYKKDLVSVLLFMIKLSCQRWSIFWFTSAVEPGLQAASVHCQFNFQFNRVHTENYESYHPCLHCWPAESAYIPLSLQIQKEWLHTCLEIVRPVPWGSKLCGK